MLAGLFLGSMTMLNILGISYFINIPIELFGVTIPFPLAVGVLPYPLTFLCTDFISELYGEKRASFLVWVGFGLNLWIVFVLWLGGVLPNSFQPEFDQFGVPPYRNPDGSLGNGHAFFIIRQLTFGAVVASMVAYLAAQLVDVHVFHFWKKLTRGKHLWLRNNGSTLVSQLVDTTAVILITHFYAHALPIKSDDPIWPQLLTFIASGYVFKMACALLDTIPFTLGVPILARYLEIDPNADVAGDETPGEAEPA